MGHMPIPSAVPSRAELIDHLIRTRIAGDVATPRENNLSHYRKLANGDRHYWLGLELGDRWTDEQDVLAVMAERCGVVDDPEYRSGQDTIDPELTVGALDRMASVLRKAAEASERVLFATGHPGGLLEVHRATAAALRAAGCEIVEIPGGLQADEGYVFQFCDVAMLERGATLWHTHSPAPMAAILDGLALTRGGRCPIWWSPTTAGRAAQGSGASTRSATRTATTPALFLGESEGTLSVVVPLDDHVTSPRFYDPMTAYLLDAAGLVLGPVLTAPGRRGRRPAGPAAPAGCRRHRRSSPAPPYSSGTSMPKTPSSPSFL
ncbi:Phosphatase OS=Streptomyces violarus OX=67380 GN=FHS41_003791 PE=4 SV=1 [Streptomyces violarus]